MRVFFAVRESPVDGARGFVGCRRGAALAVRGCWRQRRSSAWKEKWAGAEAVVQTRSGASSKGGPLTHAMSPVRILSKPPRRVKVLPQTSTWEDK